MSGGSQRCGGSSLCVSVAMQGFQTRSPVDSDVSPLLLSGREEGGFLLLPLTLGASLRRGVGSDGVECGGEKFSLALNFSFLSQGRRLQESVFSHSGFTGQIKAGL